MQKETSAEKPKKTEEIRLGVFVCHHGTHINSVINVDELTNCMFDKAFNIDLSLHHYFCFSGGSVNHWENNI